MPEYIDRDAAWEEMLFAMCGTGYQSQAMRTLRHGRWLLEPTNPYDDPSRKNRMIKRCSCCGWQNACKYNYCPNCGAKMDEEAK